MVDAGMRRFDRKSLPEVRRKPSPFGTSASNLGGYEWGCEKGLYFRKGNVEENTGMYLYVGFGNISKILISGFISCLKIILENT